MTRQEALPPLLVPPGEGMGGLAYLVLNNTKEKECRILTIKPDPSKVETTKSNVWIRIMTTNRTPDNRRTIPRTKGTSVILVKTMVPVKEVLMYKTNNNGTETNL